MFLVGKLPYMRSPCTDSLWRGGLMHLQATAFRRTLTCRSSLIPGPSPPRSAGREGSKTDVLVVSLQGISVCLNEWIFNRPDSKPPFCRYLAALATSKSSGPNHCMPSSQFRLHEPRQGAPDGRRLPMKERAAPDRNASCFHLPCVHIQRSLFLFHRFAKQPCPRGLANSNNRRML